MRNLNRLRAMTGSNHIMTVRVHEQIIISWRRKRLRNHSDGDQLYPSEPLVYIAVKKKAEYRLSFLLKARVIRRTCARGT